MKSIRLKLWSGMMILVISVLLLLWFFQIVFLEKFYINIKTNEIKNKGYYICQKSDTERWADLENQFDEFAYRENVSIELFDSNSRLMYSSGMTGNKGQMPMMRNAARMQALGEVLSGKEVAIAMTHPRFGYKFILIGLPIKMNDGFTGALFINMPVAPVEDTAAILKKQLVYITFVLLAVAVFLSSYISKTLTRPIREITQAAENMASGDFNTRIETKNKDEIGTLAHTFNYMGQELSRIDKLRKELVANVSHDLRTPLSLIRGYAETIRDVTGDNPEKRQKQLDIIIDESDRLSSIVDDILDLSQMQSGYMNLSIDHFNISKTLDDVVKRYDILATKNNIRLELKNASEVLVLGDESKIEQVLYNLINNAFNHTDRGGKITLSTIQKSETIKIEISDNGSGISQDDIRYIWDRYYKANKKSNHRPRGSGLGLTIIKGILEAHNAPFGVKSQEGEGTTFWFELKRFFKE